MIRAVLDVNVLISAFIGGADGPPRKLIYAWREGRFTLVVSPGLLNELATVLGRPKFARWSGNERAVLWIPLLDDPPDGVCVCVECNPRLARSRGRSASPERERRRAWRRRPSSPTAVQSGVEVRACGCSIQQCPLVAASGGHEG
ncbi:MAG: putative toxin-antitoxin system toxin component, PIN family [Solirubrobacteraceae bacterium]